MMNKGSRISELISRLGLDMDSYEKIKGYSIAIIGVGNLGASIAKHLAINGVDKVRIIDPDFLNYRDIYFSNVFQYRHHGLLKVEALKKILQYIRPGIDVTSYPLGIGPWNIERILRNIDIVIDATDNMATKFLVNRYIVKHSIPAIHTYVDEGYGYTVWTDASKCLECIFDLDRNLDIFFDGTSLETIYSTTSSMVADLSLKYMVNGVDIPSGEIFKVGGVEIIRINRDAKCKIHTDESYDISYDLDFDYQYVFNNGTFIYTSDEKVRLDLEPLAREIAKNYILIRRGEMGILFEYKDSVKVGVSYTGSIMVDGVRSVDEGYVIVSNLVDKIFHRYVID